MLILIWWIKLDENKVIIGRGFLHPLFYEDPYFAYPPPFLPTPTSYLLILWICTNWALVPSQYQKVLAVCFMQQGVNNEAEIATIIMIFLPRHTNPYMPTSPNGKLEVCIEDLVISKIWNLLLFYWILITQLCL